MGCEVRWYEGHEGKTVLIRLYGQVSVEDVQEANALSTELNQTTAQGAHMVVDLLGVSEFPVNIFKLMGAIKFRDAAKMGWIVLVVKQSGVLKFASTTMM